MKKTLNILMLLLIATSCFSQSWQFAKSFGGQSGSSSSNNNQPNNLVLDDYGNSYVYGTYGNLTEFEDSTIQYFTDQTRGAFIAKFNCNGEAEWYKSVAHSEQSHNQADYMILKDDYLYLSGTVSVDAFYKTWFLDTLVIGSILWQDYPDFTFPWVCDNKYSYIIKMDLNGNIVDYNLLSSKAMDLYKANVFRPLWRDWSHQRPFMIDNDGNYYLPVLAYTNEKFVLYRNNEQITDTIIPPNHTGTIAQYLLKLDSDFNPLWIKQIIEDVSAPDIEIVGFDIYDAAVDSDNNIYFCGNTHFYDENIEQEQLPVILDLGNNQTLETYGHQSSSGYLIKMNSDGDVLWTQQTKQFYEIPNSSGAVFESMVLDEENNSIYVEGYAQALVDWFPGYGTIFGDNDTIINNYEYSSAIGGFIAKYDTDGNFNWVVTPPTHQHQTGSISLHDNMIYAGTKYLIDIEQGDSTFTSDYNGFAICRWDTNGNPIDAINIPSTCTGMNAPAPFDTRVNSMGEIVVTGTYDYGLTFGDHYIYGEGFKMFIAKYGNPCPIIVNETATFCYGDEYNGSILTESGEYQFILESSNPDVDSVVNLHATVYPQLTTGINDTVFCKDQTYVLEANSGYNTYEWSTGSVTSSEEFTFTNIGTENVYVTLTDNNCTGVDTIVITIEVCSLLEQEIASVLSLYPVPSNSYITVQLSDNQKIESYSIYNLQGKLIKFDKINSANSFTITTHDLTTGQYLIYVKTEEGVYTGGFVKE